MIDQSRFFPSLANAAILATVVCASLGCDDKGTVATSSATTDGCLALDKVTYLSGSEASDCCSNGSALSPAPSGCPSATAGTMATAGTLTDGAAATAAGQGNTATAGSLASDATQAKTSAGGLTGHSSAAMAGGLVPSAGNSLADSPSNALGQALSGLKGNGSLGSASGGNTNGSLMGGGALGATSPTDSVGTLGPSGPLSPRDPGLEAGLYGSGDAAVGGALGRGSRGDGSNNDADGIAGLAGRGHSVTDLDEEGRSPAGESTMGTADPADYFRRLGSSDNIFKVVERRYVAKSKQWALADAEAIARTSSALLKKSEP